MCPVVKKTQNLGCCQSNGTGTAIPLIVISRGTGLMSVKPWKYHSASLKHSPFLPDEGQPGSSTRSFSKGSWKMSSFRLHLLLPCFLFPALGKGYEEGGFSQYRWMNFSSVAADENKGSSCVPTTRQRSIAQSPASFPFLLRLTPTQCCLCSVTPSSAHPYLTTS